MTMLAKDVVMFVVQRWEQEFTPHETMVHLVMLGHRCTTSDVKRIIRAFIDQASENVKLGRAKQ